MRARWQWFVRGIAGAVACAAMAWAWATPASAQSVVIERIEPTSGPVGTRVEIIGRNYAADATADIGGVPLQVVERLPGRLAAVIAPGASTGRIGVRSAGAVALGPLFTVTAAPDVPIITGFTPAAGPPDTEVAISGAHFSTRLTENVVMLGAQRLVVRSASPVSLHVIIPLGATSGPFVIRVEGHGEGRSAASFQVTTGLRITDFQPRAGGPGTRVTLTGTGFSPHASWDRMFLGGIAVRVESATETQLVVSIPAGATTGRLALDVRGAGHAETPEPFVVAVAPVVRSMTPARGVVGTRVTITGDSFGTDASAIRVVLGGVAVPIAAVAPRTLVVTVPAGAPTAPFTITIGTLPAVQTPAFTVLAPVAIHDFQPRSGASGTEVRLIGSGFDASVTNNRVTMAGAPLQVLSATPTELRVRITASSSGPIQVTVLEGGTASTTEPFVITAPPFVASFAPQRGLPGTEVTITGAHFGNRPALVSVTLGGQACTMRSVQDDRVVVLVPGNAATGRFRVTVQLQGTAESGADFVVLQQLTVGALRPSAATVASEIALVGTGFGTDAESRALVVTFAGGGRAPVIAGSPTAIRVRVPRGAQTGPVAVSAPDGRSASSPVFEVIQPPRITGMAPSSGPPGTRVTIAGTGFGVRTAQGAVRIGAVEMTVESLSGTQIVAVVPPGAATGRISVVIGTLSAMGPIFRVEVPPAPGAAVTITGVTAQCTRPGCLVTLTGTGFSTQTSWDRVFFGTTACRVDTATPTTLVISVPSASGTAPFTVQVRNAGSATAPTAFTITP